jgi:hypothetical protein
MGIGAVIAVPMMLAAIRPGPPSAGLGWQFDLALVPVTIAGLLVPYRKFFPRARP